MTKNTIARQNAVTITLGDEQFQVTNPELPEHLMPVAYRAYEILLKILTDHGNTPSQAQQQVLLYLLLLYFKLGTGGLSELDSRVVAALPTGYGKTSSIVAMVLALHEFGIEDISLAVSASKVEALSELKRELLALAGPEIESKIGFMHSYRYDPEIAQRYLDGDAPLPDGYASEPAVWDEPESKQFMLVTHARVRNGDERSTASFNAYQGQERSLLIYDESLLSVDVTSFSLKFLNAEMAYIDALSSTKYAGLIGWLKTVLQTLKTVSDEVSDTNPEGTLVELPKLAEEDIVAYQQSLIQRDWSQTIHAALSLAGATVRLHPSNAGLVASYTTVVQPELKRVVVLDASYIIRELVREDSRMVAIEDLPGAFKGLKPFFTKGLKTYPDMTIKTMNAPWGRSSIEEDLGVGPSQKEMLKKATGRKFINDLVRTIKAIPDREGILIFVYKERGRVSQRHTLLKALEEAGVDIHQTIDVGGEPKPRLNIATWGSETSSNNWAYCRHVILAGVMQLPPAHLMGCHLGAKDDLEAEYSKDKARTISVTESVHLIYQAASRGACRSTDGKCQSGRMTLWLVAPKSKELTQSLQLVFRGARFEKWIGDYGQAKEGKIEKVGQIVAEFLRQFDEDEISTRALKTLVPELAGLTPKSATRALEHALEVETSWLKDGRSLVRPFGMAA